MRNWKYVATGENGEILKGCVANTNQTAAQICWCLESKGYEVLSISCIRELPFMDFFLSNKKREVVYA